MAAPSTGVVPNPNSAEYAAAVTASDATVLVSTRGLFVGGAGNLAVVMAGDAATGTTTTFTSVPAGTLLPIRVVKVMSTNTTATDIVALW